MGSDETRERPGHQLPRAKRDAKRKRPGHQLRRAKRDAEIKRPVHQLLRAKRDAKMKRPEETGRIYVLRDNRDSRDRLFSILCSFFNFLSRVRSRVPFFTILSPASRPGSRAGLDPRSRSHARIRNSVPVPVPVPKIRDRDAGSRGPLSRMPTSG